MKQTILGIDLGTSSVKLLLWHEDGTVEKTKEPYAGIDCESWGKALQQALKSMDLSSVSAVGLSSQVGTYVVDDKEVISWNTSEGKTQLEELKSIFGADTFIREISMPHPDIHSYPIPRLMYIKKTYGDGVKICQPKDYLCQLLTGNCVTDPYSWRGLVNMKTGKYSEWALEYAKVKKEQLPLVIGPYEKAGEIILEDTIFKETNIQKGTPLYVGCNDFFAGLLGMGIQDEIFDITGTSEHIGVITKDIIPDTKMVNGPYFRDYVHYGVTASSGPSMDFCLKNFPVDVDIEECLGSNPPLFLPYLNGERSPVWDPDASGVFFGINEDCEKRHLGYAIMEGIVFSLSHIYEHLQVEGKSSIIVTGGAAKSPILNTLKAEMFNLPVKTLEENDTSALGAVILAAVGTGIFSDIDSAAKQMCKIKDIIYPNGIYRYRLQERFALYKQIYPSLQHLFADKKKL